MTIKNVQRSSGGYTLHLDLHKPITTATAFGVILHTPFYHASHEHDVCRSSVRNTVFGSGYHGRACDEEDAWPPLRLAEALSTVNLLPGAYLIADVNEEDEAKRLKWKTNIRLHNTCFPGIPYLTEDPRPLDTVIELLKLAERPPTPDYVRKFDSRLEKPRSCQARLSYAQWHIDLKFTPKGFAEFTMRVRAFLH